MTEHLFKPDTWESLNEKVLQVGRLAGSLLDFSAALQARSGLTLKELLAEHPGFAPAVLGGVNKDGAYAEASLAASFHRLFGVAVDTRKYCALKATSGEDAEAGVTLQVQTSLLEEFRTGPGDFQALLRSASSLAERSLDVWEDGKSSKMVQGNGEAYLDQPAKAVETTQALLQTLADLSPGVDERATFVLMTRRITWRYLIATFPIAQEPQNMAFLDQRLGLERLWEPEPNPGEGYTLWGYPDYSPWSRDDFRKGVNTWTYGGSVLGLCRLAWLVFSAQTGSAYTWYDIASTAFGAPPSLAQIFRERAQGQLMRIRRPDCPLLNENMGEGLKVRGPLAVSYWYSRTGNYNESEGVSVLTLMDWLIPSVCYGERELVLDRSNDGSYHFRITSVT